MAVYRQKSGNNTRSTYAKNNYNRPNQVRHWRDATDYREDYFKKNPGLFGCIWFCSQCGRPLFGRKQVQVDHIIPPSKFAHKKYDRKGNLVRNTSYVSERLNTTVNLVACCAKCNSKKSDRIDGIVTTRAVVGKVAETTAMTAQKGIVFTLVGTFALIRYGIGKLFRIGKKGAKNPIKDPIKVGLEVVAFLSAVYLLVTYLR